uniref:Tektin n=1 Tax=Syphacia muris TaxID=451379 RepID=A0A0N5AZF7_9BILA
LFLERAQYVEPLEPKSICENNLPETEEELAIELEKQKSRLEQLHRQVAELRELNLSIQGKEEELWDVQTAATLLNRKLKLLRVKRSASIGTIENDGPTLEMFEEKQLLATCIALREDINRCKSEIIALDDRISDAIISSATVVQPTALNNYRYAYNKADVEQEKASNNDEDSVNWKEEYTKEDTKRQELLAEIIKEKEACSLMRAKLEMHLVKQPKLLVTRF